MLIYRPASSRPASPRRLLDPLLRAAAALSFGSLLFACSAPPPMPESELFREASLALEDESYATAITSYKKLLEEYPFSDKSEVASLNIAYAHYLKEEYSEAIAAFNDFERLYPVSPLLPFVSYTIGMCWLDQARDGERDATYSDQALRQFIKVATEFPRTIYADLAQFRQQQARENLAAHELVVGDYYRERENLVAANDRYKYVISQYPTTENATRANARLKDMQEVAAAAAAPAAPAPEPTATTTPDAGPAEPTAIQMEEGAAPNVPVVGNPVAGSPPPGSPPSDAPTPDEAAPPNF